MTQGTPWRCAAASVVGVSHQTTNTPCQDAHAVRVLADGVLLVAVADGAGSARHSDVGAQVAVKAAMAKLATSVAQSNPQAWSVHLTAALEAAQAAVMAAASDLAAAPRELSATLLLVVADAHHVAAAQVGDGAVVVRWPDGQLETLCAPQRGEHLNETVFVTGLDAIAGASVGSRDQGPAALAVFTDGIEHLALTQPDDTPHAPFFAPLFRFVAAEPARTQGDATLTTFLTSPRVTARADDDLTLVLAARSP